ncbi:uncharacterized protein CEXT_678491 [Caerostris extrusa]|uniref:Uncharacterized protein n=1 Tax=Caerostris extrusa TaxID=172846 RepID=A0AAV4UM71_CAEEX|nr:uncharacterized protein CEXT_678491 [Caerostris extrusa]
MNFRQLPNREALHLLFSSHRLKKLDLSCFFVQDGETFSANVPYALPHLKEIIDICTGGEFTYCFPTSPDNTEIHLQTKKHMEDECNSLLHMLSKDPQPDLQSFVMTKIITISKFALQQLIQVSTNLTEIHTLLDCIDLNVLVNCKMLRILRLHTSPETSFRSCPRELIKTWGNVLPSLENLEIFTFCNDYFVMRPVIAIALDHCPKLTSVGHFDSSRAIECIEAKVNKSHTGYFNLKKCFWGNETVCKVACQPCQPRNSQSAQSFHSVCTRNERQNLQSSFPELINTAVSRCPFVEELSLQVLHKDCLQHLRRLKRLNSLVLECAYCDDLDVDECFSSLGEIRHQLKHFVIKRIDLLNTDRRFPLNVVIDNCENLETLGVLELTAINLPLRTNTRFRRLKRISIEMKFDGLGQILRYCDNLTYLLLFGHYMINESELQENLSHISALKLQTLRIQSRFFPKMP